MSLSAKGAYKKDDNAHTYSHDFGAGIKYDVRKAEAFFVTRGFNIINSKKDRKKF